MKISIQILAVILATLTWFQLVARFPSTMADILVSLGSFTFMYIVAYSINWLLQSEKK